MQSVTVKDGQTLYDIAVQQLGSATYVFDLAQLNGLAITDEIVSGQVLLLPDVAFEDQATVDYFTKPLYPASGDANTDVILGGIGYMQIETNFVVS